MDFITITDTITGKTLEVTQQDRTENFLVKDGIDDPTEVKKRSIGKTIRTWMRLRMKDIG